MPISSTTRTAGPFIGNGSTSAFPFAFKVFSTSDLEVVRLLSSTGVETVLALTTDYTVALNASQDSNPGGTVTLVAGALATGYTLTLTSDVANLQPTDLTNQGGFYPNVITDSLDRGTIQIQQLAGDVGRSLKAPLSDGSPDMELPVAADRASKFVAFDASGLPIMSSGTGADSGLRADLASTTLAAPGVGLVGFRADSASAVGRTSLSKLRDAVHASDFGATGDGVTDDTAALKAAFDHAIPLGLPVELRGTYLISGPIQASTTRASGHLHVVCVGSVGITVSPSATAFNYVLFIQTTAAGNASITGGDLKITCSQKAAYGLYIRHLAAVTDGTVSIECPVTVLDARQNSNNANAAGIAVYGRYSRIVIDDATVIGVTRLDVGVCRGIEVGLFDSEVCIRRPFVKNILCPATSLSDADGIAVAGTPGSDASLDSRPGSVIIEGGTFIDCQGRSMKSQCSRTIVLNPRIYRQAVVSIDSGNDFDFQFGSGLVSGGSFEYRLDGATSPLGASFSPVVFQQRMRDAQMSASFLDSTIVSDVSMPRMCLLIFSSTSVSSSTVVSGIRVVPGAAIATAVITQALVEVPNMTSTLVASPGLASVTITDVYGPVTAAGLGYTGYTTGSVAARLTLEVSGITNTLPLDSFSHVFYNISGSKVTRLDNHLFRGNRNMRALWSSFSGGIQDLDFSLISPGNQVILDLDSLSAAGAAFTSAPPWDASTNSTATVDVLSEGDTPTTNRKTIRVTNAHCTSGVGTMDRCQSFVSIDNGASWMRDNTAVPTTINADATIGTWEQWLTCDKAGSTCVLTLPAAPTNVGRALTVKTIQPQAVASAAANVIPRAGGAAGTAILAAGAGNWARMVSDGTFWVLMEGS